MALDAPDGVEVDVATAPGTAGVDDPAACFPGVGCCAPPAVAGMIAGHRHAGCPRGHSTDGAASIKDD